MKPVVIIPALNPDEKLITLAAGLKKLDLQVVIINDGSSGKLCGDLRDAASQNTNVRGMHAFTKSRGKGVCAENGHPIRRRQTFPECSGYVTADADGQHTPWDILMVANATERNFNGALDSGHKRFCQKRHSAEKPARQSDHLRGISAEHRETMRRYADRASGDPAGIHRNLPFRPR